MADTHWFDTANKVMARGARRRGFFGWLAAWFTIFAQDMNGA